ncbi:Nucleoporin Nup186/Nup192/Nup205 [Trinorchestia longiramus]|nr:Nucleoporin Nup186/Nup192/Nup205 [Trinorchestia longiramus]
MVAATFFDARGLWGSMVSLNKAIQHAVTAASCTPGSSDAIDSALKRVELAHQMNVALQKHRTTFITLLHKPKHQPDRDALQRSVTTPTAILGFSGQTKLPEALVREALLISDMYSLNELAALSLLKAAEEEKTLYPGMPRGLIAVLFYYDSREHFANAFKTLLQARQGISWTLLEGNEELSLSITRYLKPMLTLNMVDRILEVIGNMDVAKEVEMLQQNRALGDARHRRMVLDKFKSVRTLFAESLFCWSAQTPLEKDDCRRLMAYLSKVKLEETGDGTLDHVTVTLLMALLYSIEAGHLLAVEDMTDALSSFPIISDKTFVPEIHKELKNGRDWECPGLKAVVQFAWAVSLANLKQVANNIQLTDYDLYVDEDEVMLSEALKCKVFNFLEKSVLYERSTSLDSFYCRRLHCLMADFIHRMPERVKHMKTKADENAQNIIAHLREGLDVPGNIDQPFEQLLTCLAALYRQPNCSELIDEYWCDGSSMTATGALSSRQVALKNFVQLPRDFLPHSLFIPYVKFLTSLASTETSSHRLYDYLRHSSRFGPQESNLSWDHFLSALSKYYQNLRVEQPAPDSIYRSSRTARAITSQELEGLVVVMQLLTAVVERNEAARVDLSSRVAFAPIEVCAGLLTCSVPVSLKTQLLNVLSAFSKSSAIAVSVWQCIEAAGLVPTTAGAPGYSNRGIRQDIEEVESSAEEFPLSRAFVSMLIELISSGIPSQLATSMRGHGFTPYLRIVRDQVFIPHDSRTYRRAEERWAVARVCCSLFHKLVMEYQPSAAKTSGMNSIQQHPGHELVLDLVHDSNLARQLFNVLHDAVQVLEQYTDSPGYDDMQAAVKLILEMFLKILKNQRIILNSEENGTLLLIGLDKLLMSMNPRSGNCDHLLNVTRIIGHHVSLPTHATLACNLLALVGGTVSGHKHLMPLLTAPSIAVSTRQSLVQLIDHAALDEEHAGAARAAITLLKTFLVLPAPNLAHFFLGFLDGTGIRSGELRSDLLEPGVRGFPRTALHAMLSVLPTLTPQSCELTLSLLHCIASHHSTADATLRYLSSRDFVHRSLTSLPIAVEETPDRILATAWIFRIAALDLRHHASHQQRSQLIRLINVLVTGYESNPDGPSDGTMDGTVSWINNTENAPSANRGILLSLLEMLELNVDPPHPLQCQFLPGVPELVKSCEDGPNADINVEKLYQLLNQVLQDSGPGGASIAQKGPLEAEVQAVLDYALAKNAASTLLVSRRSLMEAWGQLTEVAVTVTPAETLDGPLHRAFLHAITLELTRRVLDDMARPDLTSLLVSTLLLLVSTLKTLYSPEMIPSVSANFVPALDSGEAPQVPSALLLILRGLVECVTRFRHSHQSVRANVYATLLNFLKIHSESPADPLKPKDVLSLVVAPAENSIEQYQRESYDVVKEEMSQLLSVLCCEATAGHHLCRMLALTCLSSIAALETRSGSILGTGSLLSSSPSALLEQLTQQGQLRRLLDGIEQDDQQLLNLVSTGGDLRPLYVWESRCALLAQLALNPEGARQLLQAGLMARFTKLQILGAGLEIGEGITLGAVKGALRVCQAIVSSLSSQDWSAGSQIADFLSTHMNCISSVLLTPSASIPLDTLALVASVLASTAAAGQNNSSVILLYQRLVGLIPSLIPPYAPLLKDADLTTEFLHLEILSSCLTCCCHHLLTNPRAVFFQPIVDSRSSKILNLGTLLQALKFAINSFSEASRSLSSHQRGENSSASNKELQTRTKLLTLMKKQQLSAFLCESSTYVLWRHLQTAFSSVDSGAASASRTLAITHPASLSPSPVQKSLTAAQAAALKEQVSEVFNDLLPALQQLHQDYGSKTSHVAFLPAIVARVRKIIVA